MDTNVIRERLLAIRGNLSQRKAAALYHIPLRTWENWEMGVRTPPLYVIEMMEDLKALREP